MQKFDYRAPRFSVDLPVRLTLEGSTLIGRCRDISSKGVRLELPQPLPPDACGTVSIGYQDHILELNVRVAHAGATQGGMEFMYNYASERSAVERFLAALKTP